MSLIPNQERCALDELSQAALLRDITHRMLIDREMNFHPRMNCPTTIQEESRCGRITVARNGWNLEIGIWVIDSVSNSIIDLWESI